MSLCISYVLACVYVFLHVGFSNTCKYGKNSYTLLIHFAPWNLVGLMKNILIFYSHIYWRSLVQFLFPSVLIHWCIDKFLYILNYDLWMLPCRLAYFGSIYSQGAIRFTTTSTQLLFNWEKYCLYPS